MEHDVPGVFHAEEHGEDEHESEDIHHEPLERRGRWRAIRGVTVHAGEDEQQRADFDGEDAEHEERVGRGDDLDVEAVGVVPPVIERRGGEHGDAAPCCDEGAEGSAKAEDVDRCGGELGSGREGGAQDEIAAGDSGEHAAQVDGHVGGRPESIAADAAVPGDVPVRADGDGGDGEGGGP